MLRTARQAHACKTMMPKSENGKFSFPVLSSSGITCHLSGILQEKKRAKKEKKKAKKDAKDRARRSHSPSSSSDADAGDYAQEDAKQRQLEDDLRQRALEKLDKAVE